MDPYQGAEIGAYRLDRKVGEGAFGAVWSGTHVETGARAAFKVLLPAAAANAEQVSRFHREAELLGRAKSPNVARQIDFVVDPKFGVVLVMELIVGEQLSELLSAARWDAARTVELGVQILAGVHDLHSVGIIHRDLKPHNIMLADTTDGGMRVVIFDLGLSRLLKTNGQRDPAARSITPSFVVLGTLACVAPEQILNAREVTERSDLYAVGTILFHAMTGRYPFWSDDDKDLARQKLTDEAPLIPADEGDPMAMGLRDVIAKAIRRRPAERYETAAGMRASLLQLEASVRAAREERERRRADEARRALERRGRRRWIGLVAFTATLSALIAWRVWRS